MNWLKHLAGKIRAQESLRKHTTFRIGGPAEFFVEPYDITDLKFLLTSAKRRKMPIFVIGAGSNILISDRGIKAIVLRLNSACFKKIFRKQNYLEAGSGLSLGGLIQAARKYGLSGTEFLTGIPGTVGGALAMNAGAWGRSIGSLVEKVNLIDYNGNLKVLRKKEVRFGYRKSSLARYIILSVSLKLTERNKKAIDGAIRKYRLKRLCLEDSSFPNAGCAFRNPPQKSAGRLIDLCGLKGKRVGGACISSQHANFILNQGNARAEDVLRLMDLAKREVKKKFGIDLKPEIKIWQ